jgi:hypothetical protein
MSQRKFFLILIHRELVTAGLNLAVIFVFVYDPVSYFYQLHG